jgi:oligosaccharide repeat unit polymerase
VSRLVALGCLAGAAGLGFAATRVPASAGAFWLAILWVIWVFGVCWALTRRPFSILLAAIMAAMLQFVILPATGAEVYGNSSIAGNYYQAGVVPALRIATFAECAMLAGAMAVRTLWPVSGFVWLAPRLSPAGLDRVSRWSVAVGMAGVVATSVLGGANLRDFFVYTTATGYGTFASEVTGNLGFLVAVQCVAGLAVVLLPLRLGRAGQGRLFGPLFFAFLATILLLGGGQRGRFFVAVFAAGLIWLKTSKRRLPPRRVAVTGMLLLVVLGGVVGIARGAADSRHLSASAVLTAPFTEGNNLFLPVAGLASIVPGQFPYLDGLSYAQVAIFPVPRALWPGKPQDAIGTVTDLMDPGNSGLAFPEFGEMYANFGLPGVVAGSILFGAFAELLWRRFARSRYTGEAVFTAVCGAILLILFTRGDIAPMITTFSGLLVVTAVTCRRRSAAFADAGELASELAAEPVPGAGPGSEKSRWPAVTA